MREWKKKRKIINMAQVRTVKKNGKEKKMDVRGNKGID